MTGSPETVLAASIKEKIEKTEKIQLINGLIAFIDCHLAPSEESSLVSKLEPVDEGTTIAAEFINTVSEKAEAVTPSEILKYIPDDITLKAKDFEESHWLFQGLILAAYTTVKSQILKEVEELGKSDWRLFLGLAAAAYTINRCVQEESVESNCWELMSTVLELAKALEFFRKEMPYERKILELAKDQKKFSEEKHKILKKAVTTIVEGAVMCCDYIEKRNKKKYSFWSTTTLAIQLVETRRIINETTSYLDIRRQNRDLAEKPKTKVRIPAFNITWEESDVKPLSKMFKWKE